jgi:uncharacterized protein (TIGR00730 family)
MDAARDLGRFLAEQGITLVYGGASVGAMGAVADGALDAGGEVIGVMPRALVEYEIAQTRLSDLRVVESMHERKALMAELSDGFITLPGGLGTFEEFFEVVTWAQLGMHHKPCGLLNICHYYDELLRFLDHAVREQLLRQEHRDMILVDDSAPNLLAKLRTYQVTAVEKWLER